MTKKNDLIVSYKLISKQLGKKKKPYIKTKKLPGTAKKKEKKRSILHLPVEAR